MLASLQKKKNSHLFKAGEPRTVIPYTIRPEIIKHQNLGYFDMSGGVAVLVPPPSDLIVKGRTGMNSEVLTSAVPKFEVLYGENLKTTLAAHHKDGIQSTLKDISTNLVGEVPPDLLVSIYMGHSINPTTTPKQNMKFNMFDTKPQYLGYGKHLKCDGIEVNGQGQMPISFYKLMALQGLNFSLDKAKTASHVSGGHATLRTLVNLLIADHWDRIISILLDPIRPGRNDVILLLQIGDKYMKSLRLLNSLLVFDKNVWFPRVEKDPATGKYRSEEDECKA